MWTRTATAWRWNGIGGTVCTRYISGCPQTRLRLKSNSGKLFLDVFVKQIPSPQLNTFTFGQLNSICRSPCPGPKHNLSNAKKIKLPLISGSWQAVSQAHRAWVQYYEWQLYEVWTNCQFCYRSKLSVLLKKITLSKLHKCLLFSIWF